MGPASSDLELRLGPGSTRFDPMDDRWLEQVVEFAGELEREVGGVTHETEPVAGSKGAVSSILLTMSSAGVFTMAADFFKAWLGRDKTRSLKLSWTEEGAPRSVEITSDKLDSKTLNDLAREVTKRFSGQK